MSSKKRLEPIEEVLLAKLKAQMLNSLEGSFKNSKLLIKTQRETIEHLQLKLKNSEKKVQHFCSGKSKTNLFNLFKD